MPLSLFDSCTTIVSRFMISPAVNYHQDFVCPFVGVRGRVRLLIIVTEKVLFSTQIFSLKNVTKDFAISTGTFDVSDIYFFSPSCYYYQSSFFGHQLFLSLPWPHGRLRQPRPCAATISNSLCVYRERPSSTFRYLPSYRESCVFAQSLTFSYFSFSLAVALLMVHSLSPVRSFARPKIPSRQASHWLTTL